MVPPMAHPNLPCRQLSAIKLSRHAVEGSSGPSPSTVMLAFSHANRAMWTRDAGSAPAPELWMIRLPGLSMLAVKRMNLLQSILAALTSMEDRAPMSIAVEAAKAEPVRAAFPCVLRQTQAIKLRFTRTGQSRVRILRYGQDFQHRGMSNGQPSVEHLSGDHHRAPPLPAWAGFRVRRSRQHEGPAAAAPLLLAFWPRRPFTSSAWAGFD